MHSSTIMFGVTNIACGILFILVSIPLVAKKVPMNKLYGFRLSKSFVSDENWYTINRYGGKQLIKWSVPLIFIGVLYFIFPINELESEIQNTLLAVAPIILCVGAAIVKTVVFARKL